MNRFERCFGVNPKEKKLLINIFIKVDFQVRKLSFLLNFFHSSSLELETAMWISYDS